VNRVLAIAQKELLHIVRDRRNLAFVLIMPIFMLLLFAYALSFDVRNVPTVTLDMDHTAQSRLYLDSISHSSFFQVVGSVPDVAAADAAFQKGQARVVVLVRQGFGDKIVSGGKGEVQVLLDGSEPNSAQLGQAYANALSRQYGQRVTMAALERRGAQPGQFGSLQPHVRLWYNPEANSSWYLVPGLIVVIVMIIAVQQTATTLVREEDAGTLEQLLVSPLHRMELVVGKVAPWIVIVALDTVVISLAAVFVFGIPFLGSVWLFALGVALFVLCCLALGILISSRSTSVEVANQTALLVSFLPAFMLSGFVFPIANIPPILQWASYLFPARYMIVIVRTLFLKGAGWDVLWAQYAMLAAYAVIALTLASVSYRRKFL
jgi:ABC-2 type transport system permease protein